MGQVVVSSPDTPSTQRPAFSFTRSHLLQVFDATNTTSDRRDLILSFARDNGYKVGAPPSFLPSPPWS